MTKPLVIAYQREPGLDSFLKSGLPLDISWRALPPDQSWDVPDDATILIAAPSRDHGGAAPVTAPPGWPRGLQWIQTVSSGVDEYPKWIYEVPWVTCARGTNAVPIAEYVLASMLGLEKKFSEIWVHGAADWKTRDLGTLDGKTLGLIGYGGIGRAIAARALPFGMNIIAARRSATRQSALPGVRFVELDEVLAGADHLVVAIPLTDATARLIGHAAFEKMKPDVHFINVARGRIVDHDALLDSLDQNRIGFATLDVTEPEPLPAGHRLYTHPRVHISPHTSWRNGKRGEASIALFIANLQRFIAGEPLEGLVNADLGY